MLLFGKLAIISIVLGMAHSVAAVPVVTVEQIKADLDQARSGKNPTQAKVTEIKPLIWLDGSVKHTLTLTCIECPPADTAERAKIEKKVLEIWKDEKNHPELKEVKSVIVKHAADGSSYTSEWVITEKVIPLKP
ncbi:hypothetical protein FRB91_008233 [Serendipita sp. 411]|nr:hypothetical protein FRC15_007804 [Serendipita sp. 397]KAG8861367.1 hypothetical protein FRB91_008233 [Serendipita sp. 411]